MMKNLKKNKKKGFTLIELIVVIAILAIIAALAIPSFNGVRQNAAKEIAMANARTVYTAGMAAEAVAKTPAEITTQFNTFVADMQGTGITTAWAADTNVATWKGTINGTEYTATYDATNGGQITVPAAK